MYLSENLGICSDCDIHRSTVPPGVILHIGTCEPQGQNKWSVCGRNKTKMCGSPTKLVRFTNENLGFNFTSVKWTKGLWWYNKCYKPVSHALVRHDFLSKAFASLHLWNAAVLNLHQWRCRIFFFLVFDCFHVGKFYNITWHNDGNMRLTYANNSPFYYTTAGTDSQVG